MMKIMYTVGYGTVFHNQTIHNARCLDGGRIGLSSFRYSWTRVGRRNVLDNEWQAALISLAGKFTALTCTMRYGVWPKPPARPPLDRRTDRKNGAMLLPEMKKKPDFLLRSFAHCCTPDPVLNRLIMLLFGVLQDNK